jgi:hypothetical protein
VQPAVWDAEVVFAGAEVELSSGVKTGSLGERTEQPGQLPFERAVRTRRGGDHVQHTLPDLVESVKT